MVHGDIRERSTDAVTACRIALAEDVERGGSVPPGLAKALRAIARDLFTRRAGPPAALEGGTPIGREHARAEIVAMRRELGLALEGAEASLERMLAEPPPLRHGEERAMYVVTYTRRLGASITELLESGGSVSANVAAYLGRAINEARGRAGAPATPPPPVPAGTGAMELLVRRGELLARTARAESAESRPGA